MVRLLSLAAALAVAMLFVPSAKACDYLQLQAVYAAPVVQQYVQPLQVQSYAVPVIQRQVVVQRQAAYVAPAVQRQRVVQKVRVRRPLIQRQVVRQRNVVAY